MSTVMMMVIINPSSNYIILKMSCLGYKVALFTIIGLWSHVSCIIMSHYCTVYSKIVQLFWTKLTVIWNLCIYIAVTVPHFSNWQLYTWVGDRMFMKRPGKSSTLTDISHGDKYFKLTQTGRSCVLILIL